MSCTHPVGTCALNVSTKLLEKQVLFLQDQLTQRKKVVTFSDGLAKSYLRQQKEEITRLKAQLDKHKSIVMSIVGVAEQSIKNEPITGIRDKDYETLKFICDWGNSLLGGQV